MTPSLVNFLSRDYLNTLKIINGVNFTPRQVDILACLLNGRNPKTISNLLSISLKTVDSHTENIKQRAGCYSRQHILRFIEKSGKLSLFNKHYLMLLNEDSFKKNLQKISLELHDIPSINIWGCFSDKNLLNVIVNHFTILGFSIKKNDLSDENSPSFNPFPEPSITLYAFSKELLEMNKKKLYSSLESIVEAKKHTSQKIICISLDEEGEKLVPEGFLLEKFTKFETLNNYSQTFFELIEKIIPSFPIKKFGVELNTLNSDFLQPLNKSNFELEISQNKAIPIKNNRKIMIFMGFLMFLLLNLFFFFKNFEFKTEFYKNNLAAQKVTIRSELLLPYETFLLNRSEILKTIEKKLRQKNEIQTVVLVGFGGAGKTTLARQYARSQAAPIVWEINAQTKSTLLNSFEELAMAMAKTTDQKKELHIIWEIKNQEEREKSLLFFIKQELKSYSNWVLIYDGVEMFSEIKGYFPFNSHAWGNGKVIITTRDENIQDNTLLNTDNIIKIQKLGSQEKYSLFTKIMYGKFAKTIKTNQKKELKLFLENLPPFPLDITTAAYCIKHTKISCQEYLKRSRSWSYYFGTAQESFLKEISDYEKTRYGLVVLSLKKIIEENPHFQDLFLFISLLDFQNIPTEILKELKKGNIVEEFIINLRKHSFITNEKLVEGLTTFSIHQSIQTIALSYLTKKLSLQKNKELIKTIAKIMARYLVKIKDEGFHLKMNLLVNHGERILEHKQIISTISQEYLKSEIGRIHFYLGNYKKTITLLKKSLEKKSNKYNGSTTVIARILGTLGVTYQELGDYEKSKILLKKSLVFYEKKLNKKHSERAWTLEMLGDTYNKLGQYKKSKFLLEKSLRTYEKVYTKNDPRMTGVFLSLGIIQNRLGNYKIAKSILKKALTINKQNYKEINTYWMVWITLYLGRVYNNLGFYKKAIKMLTYSLKIHEEFFGKDHIETSSTLVYLGEVYNKLGFYKKARKLLEESLRVRKSFFGNTHVETIWVLVYLGRIYNNLGLHKKAIDSLQQAHKIYESLYGATHIRVARILVYLSETHGKLNQYKEAKSFLKKASSIYEKHFGTDHIRMAQILEDFGAIYLREGKLEISEKYLTEALKILEKNNHSNIYMCLEYLGDLYKKKLISKNKSYTEEEAQKAIYYFDLSLKALKKDFPPDSPHIKRIECKLKDMKNSQNLASRLIRFLKKSLLKFSSSKALTN